MNNIFLKITLFVAFIGIIVTGCQKEEMNELAEPEVVMNDFNEKSAAIEELAIATAAAMVDPDFRMSIKSEAMKQFDGDYDILYSCLAKQSLKNGNHGNFYLNKLSESYKSTGKNSKAYIESLISQIPKFQIAVPVHCENWDVQNHAPLVAYIPANFDEKTFTKVKAFDQDGNVHWLPLDKEPEFPVVVLGYNERTDENGNLLNGFKYIQPDPGGGTGSGGGASVGPRKDGDAEYVEKFKFTNLNAVAPWAEGKPEIRMRVFAIEYNDLSEIHSAYWKPDRKDVNNKWYVVNNLLCYWDWSRYGDALILSWYEEDWGGPEDITISYSGFSVSFSIQNYDDEIIRKQVILKTDPESTVYNAGIFRWLHKY